MDAERDGTWERKHMKRRLIERLSLSIAAVRDEPWSWVAVLKSWWR